jgi:hypothetical protein
LEFQGFQSALSPYLIFAIAIALIALSFISYRNQKALTPALRLGLSSLRAITFLVIMLLVLNPFFFSTKEENQNPKVLVLLDNSESVSISKGEYNGIQDYQSALDQLISLKPEQVEADFFSVGSSTKQIQSIDSLTFNETSSNFIDAVTQVQELEDDYSAALLISDGIITFGRNPLITASNLDIPFYTIGLGDTSSVRDITINNIITNATGYTDTRHIVEIEIAQNGFDGSPSTIQINDSEGQSIVEREIEFTGTESITLEEFEILLTEEGLIPFEVEISSRPEEWSTENNSQSFSIDVLDSKTRVLHIASEIHPDVKFIRTLLSTDPSMELQTLTWLGGNQFVEQDNPEFENLDLIILHGNPSQIPSLTFMDLIEDVPTLFLDLPNSRRFNNRQSNYALIQNLGSQVFEMSIFPSTTIESHPIMEFDEIQYDALAPVLSSLRTEVLVADAIDLLKIGFQGIQTESAMMVVTERGDLRRAHLSSWGWYRLFQSPSEDEQKFVTQLFSNVVSWASNNPDNRRLKISPSQSTFNSTDQVIINASLINESGNPEPDATIELHIYSEDTEERVFNLNNLGSGNYSLTLDQLNTGLFSFSATARKDNRVIDEQSGEFLVEDSNTEFINTQRNDELLSGLANETGGSFFKFDEVSELWTNVSDSDVLESNLITVESYHFPVRSIFWFIIVVLLLGTEWILRKFYSLP